MHASCPMRASTCRIHQRPKQWSGALHQTPPCRLQTHPAASGTRCNEHRLAPPALSAPSARSRSRHACQLWAHPNAHRLHRRGCTSRAEVGRRASGLVLRGSCGKRRGVGRLLCPAASTPARPVEQPSGQSPRGHAIRRLRLLVCRATPRRKVP